MDSLARFFRKLNILVRRGKFNRELEEEMAFHREQAEGALRSDGVAPEAVRDAAKRQFGNETRMKERSNEEVRFAFESVFQDLRYAVRQLVSNPSFTIVIVLTLALSIGANSAIFSVIHGVLLKSLPYPEPDRLVRVFLTSPDFPRFPLNPFDFRDFRSRNRSFESFAAFTRGDVQLSGAGEAERLYGFGITAGYFHVLGLKLQLGREFDEHAEVPGNGLQVVISDRLWRTKFGADANILGRKITLNSQPFTVVGVMPAGMEHPGNEYHSLPYGEGIDVWWPFSFAGDPANRGSHFIEGIGRLREGVSLSQASSEMNSLMTQIQNEHGGGTWKVLLVPLSEEIVGTSRRMLLVLLGAVIMVLLIACANAANLLLARAATRQREIAVRLALGAPRSRLVRQLLTESLLISFLGGAMGLAFAFGGVRFLVSMLPADFPRAHDIHVSVPVFVFTFLVSIATGIAFGLAPALQASRTDPRQSLHEGGRSATASGRQRRLRSALVVSEVGLAFILLIGAGLMFRSLINLIRLDPGFQQEHVLTVSLSLPHEKYKERASVARFYDRLVTAVAVAPGVESVGAGSDLPWTGYDENTGFAIQGKQPPPHQEFHARYHMATPDYFRALGIPLIRGRFITSGDNESAPKVVLINQSMANKYWPNEGAVGRRITFDDNPKEKDWLTVVGIVGDVKDRPNSPGAEPAFWWPELQAPQPDMSLVVRAKADPLSLINTVRNAVGQLDPTLAVADIRLMDQIADTSVATPRLAFLLVGLFAVLAIVLAVIGTYGVISYSVTQRSAEFGLRIALGAQREDVIRLVLSQAAMLVMAGTALGVVLALTLGGLLRNLIYQVSPFDPLTFATVGIAVISVALPACYIPARRATQSDPMTALRSE